MKRLSPIFGLASLLVAACTVYPQPALADGGPAKLTLTVTGITEHKGALSIGVFDKAGYQSDTAVTGGNVPVTGDTVTVSYELPPGEYGIKMFHDVDGDGKMGMNPFGMPIEPFAFSNNAPVQFGPPGWEAASFTVAAPATAHAIKLN